MDSFLVVGAETVVGANLAAYLVEHVPGAVVTALTADAPISIHGCECRVGDLASAGAAQRWIEQLNPAQVILCGAAARSSWELNGTEIGAELTTQARDWAAACRAAGVRCTYISSDAVFTGPWMFHNEEGAGHCDSAAAARIRAAEQHVLDEHPQALVVRTNAFGWSPRGSTGWIEQRLRELQTKRLADQDFIRHGTPILATDLAGILVRAWSEGLSGLHHVAGAERVSPLRFVQRLAETYHLPWLSIRRGEALQERACGFGEGECSLQTKRIRKAICVAMPMLSEGLARLAEQDQTGFRGRLCGETRFEATRAA